LTDLFFLHRDRRGSLGPTRVNGSADLVVEVTSPGTRSYDLEEKASAPCSPLAVPGTEERARVRGCVATSLTAE